jgi:hypothetical protein
VITRPHAAHDFVGTATTEGYADLSTPRCDTGAAQLRSDLFAKVGKKARQMYENMSGKKLNSCSQNID